MKTSIFLIPILLCGCQPKQSPSSSTSSTENQVEDGIPTPSSFIGLPIKEAEEKAKKADLPYRIIKQDGQDFPVTRDYHPARLNFTVENGLVTEVKNG